MEKKQRRITIETIAKLFKNKKDDEELWNKVTTAKIIASKYQMTDEQFLRLAAKYRTNRGIVTSMLEVQADIEEFCNN